MVCWTFYTYKANDYVHFELFPFLHLPSWLTNPVIAPQTHSLGHHWTCLSVAVQLVRGWEVQGVKCLLFSHYQGLFIQHNLYYCYQVLWAFQRVRKQIASSTCFFFFYVEVRKQYVSQYLASSAAKELRSASMVLIDANGI